MCSVQRPFSGRWPSRLASPEPQVKSMPSSALSAAEEFAVASANATDPGKYTTRRGFRL